MPATRRTRAQTTKAAKVSLDTILLATAVGAGAAAYFFLDVAPEVVVASCVAALTVILIYGGKVQKYVRGRKPKAAKKAAPKSPKPTRIQPKRSATPEPLSRKPSSPKKKPAKPAASQSRQTSPKKPASKPKKPAAKSPRRARRRSPRRSRRRRRRDARGRRVGAVDARDAGRAQDDARDGRRLQEQRLHEVPPAQVGELARGELKHIPLSPPEVTKSPPFHSH